MSEDAYLSGLAERLAGIRAQIEAHRVVPRVTLIAATKGQSAASINALCGLGQFDIGENRAQEFLQKLPDLDGRLVVHMIGQLQSNKAHIIRHVGLIHSLDRLSLAKALHKEAERECKPVDALVEVNMTGDPARGGVAPEEVEAFLDAIAPLCVRVTGLMTVAPLGAGPEDTRGAFRAMRRLFDRLAAQERPNAIMWHLSMGMSEDYVIALQEGATMIRIGRALMGQRG